MTFPFSRAEIVERLKELADTVDAVKDDDYSEDAGELLDPEDAVSLRAAAAELSRVCATCVHFNGSKFKSDGECLSLAVYVPKDGSGFCHRHEPKAEDH